MRVPLEQASPLERGDDVGWERLPRLVFERGAAEAASAASASA